MTTLARCTWTNARATTCALLLGASQLVGTAFAPTPSSAAGTLQAEDLRYLGAFRLPSAHGSIGSGESGDLLSYCEGVEAYYSRGDASGPDDGFPGSLYGIGHAWTTPAFEISIPRPVVSDDVNALPVATLLQGPVDIASSIWIEGDGLKGIEYLPALGSMTVPKLHISFGQHYQYDRRPTQGWVDLDLSHPNPKGPWNVGTDAQVNCLNTNEYIFSIPEAWATEHANGMRLACGRHREGQIADGPSIIAYSDWTQGNPPAAGIDLAAKPLLLYGTSSEKEMDSHCWADNWTGGAWLYNESKSAVVIVGTKGFGDCWYGWQDGTRPEECAHWPGGCEGSGYGGSDRGFYASYFKTVMLFFDPADLAKVANGTLASWDPQPYRMWDITPFMMQPESNYEIGLGGVAYDEARGRLFVSEFYGDKANNKPVIHVFAIDPPHDPPNEEGNSAIPSGPNGEVFASPNPFRERTTLHLLEDVAVTGPRPALRVAIYDIRGNLLHDLGSTDQTTIDWEIGDRPNGIYFLRAWNDQRAWTSKISVVR